MSNHPITDEAERRFRNLSDIIGPLELIAIIRELEVENRRLEAKNRRFEKAFAYVAREFCFSLEKARRIAATTLKIKDERGT